jgi:hypothetical protein
MPSAFVNNQLNKVQCWKDGSGYEAEAETAPDSTKDTKFLKMRKECLLKKVVCTGIVSSSSSSLKA